MVEVGKGEGKPNWMHQGGRKSKCTKVGGRGVDGESVVDNVEGFRMGSIVETERENSGFLGPLRYGDDLELSGRMMEEEVARERSCCQVAMKCFPKG
jgi:hypothetical protein